MRERIKRKSLSVPAGILTIVGLLIGIVLLAMIMYVIADALDSKFQLPKIYMQYVEYALFILIGVLIIRHWLTEYEYVLVDDTLTVDRYIGKRPRTLLNIKLADITKMGSAVSFSGKKQRLTLKSKRRGVVYIVYKKDGEEKCVYLSPGEQLLGEIEKRRKR